MAKEDGGGAFILAEAIILNISVKWDAIIRWRRLIEGWLLLEEIR